MTTKPKGGRPQKYNGEKPVRIGAMIRPRHKEMLEKLARMRGCTLGDAMEYCVAKVSLETIIPRSDGETIYDIVIPDNEIALAISDSKRPQSEIDAPTEETIKEVEELEENINKYAKMSPYASSTLTASDEFFYGVAMALGSTIIIFYRRGTFLSIVRECWKRGYRENDVACMFKEELHEYLQREGYDNCLSPLSVLIKNQ